MEGFRHDGLETFWVLCGGLSDAAKDVVSIHRDLHGFIFPNDLLSFPRETFESWADEGGAIRGVTGNAVGLVDDEVTRQILLDSAVDSNMALRWTQDFSRTIGWNAVKSVVKFRRMSWKTRL